MTISISSSVGAGGKNTKADTTNIQKYLAKNGYRIGSIDGICGPKTLGAILHFQGKYTTRPSGLIEPGSEWLHALNLGALGENAKMLKPSNIKTTEKQAPPPTTSAGTSITALIPRPDKKSINIGLTPVNWKYMVEKLGMPRENITKDCMPITNPALKRHFSIASVGPFRVNGLNPAIQSLALIMGQIKKEQPEIYRALGTDGMLCCRWVRNSTTAISNHSWGTAIDLKLAGKQDKQNDNKVLVGLSLIAPIFNAHGWYWGAGFRTEDGMHFEATRPLIEKWAQSIG